MKNYLICIFISWLMCHGLATGSQQPHKQQRRPVPNPETQTGQSTRTTIKDLISKNHNFYLTSDGALVFNSLNITDLDGLETIPHINEVKYINLQCNQIEKIKRSQFKNCASLEQLDLSNNQIMSIERGSFSGLHNLKTLNLTANKLDRLSDSEILELLNGVPNLQKLYVNENNLKEYQKDLVSLAAGVTVEVIVEPNQYDEELGTAKCSNIQHTDTPITEDTYTDIPIAEDPWQTVAIPTAQQTPVPLPTQPSSELRQISFEEAQRRLQRQREEELFRQQQALAALTAAPTQISPLRIIAPPPVVQPVEAAQQQPITKKRKLVTEEEATPSVFTIPDEPQTITSTTFQEKRLALVRELKAEHQEKLQNIPLAHIYDQGRSKIRIEIRIAHKIMDLEKLLVEQFKVASRRN